MNAKQRDRHWHNSSGLRAASRNGTKCKDQDQDSNLIFKTKTETIPRKEDQRQRTYCLKSVSRWDSVRRLLIILITDTIKFIVAETKMMSSIFGHRQALNDECDQNEWRWLKWLNRCTPTNWCAMTVSLEWCVSSVVKCLLELLVSKQHRHSKTKTKTEKILSRDETLSPDSHHCCKARR